MAGQLLPLQPFEEAAPAPPWEEKTGPKLLILGFGPAGQAFAVRCGMRNIPVTASGAPGFGKNLAAVQKTGGILAKGRLATGADSETDRATFPVNIELDLGKAIRDADYILLFIGNPGRHEFIKSLVKYDLSGKVLGSISGAEDPPLIVKYTNASFGVGFTTAPNTAKLDPKDGNVLWIKTEKALFLGSIIQTGRPGVHPPLDKVKQDLEKIFPVPLVFKSAWEALSHDATLELHGITSIMRWPGIQEEPDKPFYGYHMKHDAVMAAQAAVHEDKKKINAALGWGVSTTCEIINQNYGRRYRLLKEYLDDNSIPHSQTAGNPPSTDHRYFKDANKARLWKKLGEWLGIQTPAIDRLFDDAKKIGIDLWDGADTFDELGIKDLGDFIAVYQPPKFME